MKVKVTYPQIVSNTIEIDIPEEELKDDMDFDEKFELAEKHGVSIPSYDKPEYLLCKQCDNAGYMTFKITKNERLV